MDSPGVEGGACLVLVDYDNAFPPSAAHTDQEISLRVERWLRRLSALMPLVELFEVRLYGGWYDDQDLSRHGSNAARTLTLMPEFPILIAGGRVLRGSISLAVGPLILARNSPLLGTYRRRSSLPRVRLSDHPYPESCSRVDPSCPAAILQSFTKSASRQCPVESCSLVAKDAFVVHEQKMVDTLLATDLLTAGHSGLSYAAVIVVSGDSDFVPPLLAARHLYTARLAQLLPRGEESSEYAVKLLRSAGIEILEVS